MDNMGLRVSLRQDAVEFLGSVIAVRLVSETNVAALETLTNVI